MLRRITVLITVLAVAAIGLMPSYAAVKKAKHPGWKGSYTLTLYPDPTTEVYGQLSKEGCLGLSPKGKDIRSFTVPAAGKLTMSLISPDPTNKGLTDWDLWLITASGTTVDASHGSTSNEQVIHTFKSKTTFNVQVCNLIGTTSGTVSWVFKYA